MEKQHAGDTFDRFEICHSYHEVSNISQFVFSKQIFQGHFVVND